MKKTKLIRAVVITIGISIALALYPALAIIGKEKKEIIPTGEISFSLTHAQTIWISALEWCESRGKKTAINAKDLDGTPSYYSFQFKPGTFLYFGQLYGVLDKGLTLSDITDKDIIKDYEITKDIVEAMVAHRNEISWETQFPGCVRQIGKPPAY